jgi:uncharacterized membrane protein YfcA
MIGANPIFVIAAAVLAGMVNSIAGGGTLLTFPALIALGIPPIAANATSTVALWPGAVASAWGYRSHLDGAGSWVVRFIGPSIAGGLVGALLLLATPPARFAALAPWLVLGATGLFAAQPLVQRLLVRRTAPGGVLTRAATDGAPVLPPPTTSLVISQFLVAVYGGYFGAGIGIVMLAALGLMGLTSIHQMNGLKNIGGASANVTAAAIFAASGIVNWPVAGMMAVGAMLGGYLGSRMAQRVPPMVVRRSVLGIGIASGAWMLWERFAH